MNNKTTLVAIAMLTVAVAAMGIVSMQSVQADKPTWCFDYINDSGEAGTACTTNGHKQCDNDMDGSGYQITKKCYKQ